MFKWIVFTPVRPAACAFALAMMGAIAVVGTGTHSVAQEKEKKAAPKPAVKGKEAPKAAPKQEPQAQPDAPQLIFSPWTKFCLKGQEANAKQVCFTGKDGRVESGQPVVAAVLIEPDGE